MIVMKFGGTSLANAERIKNVADILKSRLGKADGGIININMNKGKPGEVLSKLGELLYG